MQPTEDVFNEAFQQSDPEERKHYRGRHDLSGLPPVVRDQLRLIQKTFITALRNEKAHVPGHVDHPPFHVDYVDSDIPNALAFRYRGNSFIGITIPLVYSVSNVCLILSKSASIAALVGIRPSAGDYNELHAVLFSILISFIVAHEYTHHVHGHVIMPAAGSLFPNEILDNGRSRDLAAQIQEAVADGYAVYHVLANFVDGPGRSWLVVLKLDGTGSNIQDQILLSLLVLAVGSYLFLRQPPPLNPEDLYKDSHPPHVIRMDFIM